MRATAQQQAKLAARLPKQGRSKLGNTWTRCKYEHSHQSKKEAARCEELHLWQKAGLIEGLNRKVRFYLNCRLYYECDFLHFGAISGLMTIEDVKGWKGGDRYRIFKLKTAWMREK